MTLTITETFLYRSTQYLAINVDGSMHTSITLFQVRDPSWNI